MDIANPFGVRLNRLRWKLTFSYTGVTIGAILAAARRSDGQWRASGSSRRHGEGGVHPRPEQLSDGISTGRGGRRRLGPTF
jgi:hypothetical protein